MLLYLSSNQNIGLFDFLTKENGIIIKKLSGMFSLKQFVLSDMRNISHYSFVAIDLSALNDTQDEIIEAVTAFKSMYCSRLIIFAEGMEYTTPHISRLIEEGIYNIITATDIEDIQSDILQCISERGKSYYDVVRNSERKYLFKEENIKIAVAGALNRAGTTTTAMNLSEYLSSISAKVCYIEANNSSHLLALSKAYSEMKTIENGYRHRGVDYYSINAGSKGKYDFTVFDFGVVNDKTLKAFQYSDKVILCGGCKPYELDYLYKAFEKIKGLSVNTILSFVPEYIRADLKRKLDTENNKIHFAEYSSDLFNGDVNKRIWDSIAQDYIVEEVNSK